MAKKDFKQLAEQAREKAVDTIVKMMEEKGLAWTREWGNAFGTDGALPRNGITNRWYAGSNVMHLLASALEQGFTDPRWFTFNQAKSLGYFPRKGDSATLVEYHKRMRGMLDADGKWTRNEDECEKVVYYWKLVGVFYVFNAEQLFDKDGNAMPKEDLGTCEEEHLDEYLCECADELIATSRCRVNEKKGGLEAFYSPTGDSITLPARTQFKDMESFIGTLTHEMTHSTQVPLNRDTSGYAFNEQDRAFEELVAELGSVFCCLELGVHRTEELEADKNFKNHAAYLKSWLGALQDDKNFLFKAAGMAASAATYIMGRYYGIAGETEEKAA